MSYRFHPEFLWKGREVKFLIVGLGSMGRRRIRNLVALGEREIIGFDLRDDRRKAVLEQSNIRVCESFEDGMAAEPDAVIVSTPPDQHTRYALAAARDAKHFFTEASVLDDGLEALEEESRRRGIVAAPSCTMRFHPAIRKAKGILDDGSVGRVLAFTHHFGEYLPRWHPWEDYRDFYVSRRSTGGCREIVTFELVWLTWLCGQVETISALTGKIGDLGVDIDDVYQIILRFKSGTLGHLQVDVLQRTGYRQSRFVCSEGVISWDWDARKLLVYTADGCWREYTDTFTQASVEGYYIDEMAAFLAAVRNEKAWPYTLAEDRRILGMLRASELSAQSGGHISLDSLP